MDATEEPKRSRKKSRGIASVIFLFVALLLSGRLLLPDTVGEHVRRSFVKILSDHYSECTISVGAGRYEPGKGMVLTDIEIRDRSLPKTSLPLLVVDRILIETKVDLGGLKDGGKGIRAEQIILSGVTLNVWELEDSRWSPEMLLPPPSVGPGCPMIVGGGVRLRLCRDSDAGAPALELQDVTFSLAQHTDLQGRQAKKLIAQGGGGFLEAFNLQAILDYEGNIRAAGKLTAISVDSRAHLRLPDSLKRKLSAISQSAALADVQWEVSGNNDNLISNWQAKVNLHDGRFAHHDLPVSAEKLHGFFRLSPAGLRIEKVEGTIDGAECQVAGLIAGLSWPCDASLQVKAKRLNLSPEMLSILPEKPRKISNKIQPTGTIDFVGELTHRNLTWNCDVVVQCHDIDVNLDIFPYPLHAVNGVVRLKNRVTTAENLTCRLGQSIVRSSFQLSPQDSDIPHWIQLNTNQPLRIDETLLAALTPRGEKRTGLEKFVRSLSPGGSVQLIGAKFQRRSDGKLGKQIDLEVTDGRLRYEGFSYPLYEVRGRIWVDDQQVKLSQFQAQNTGGAQVQCEGEWIPLPEQSAGRLDLTFRAYNILLDDGLRAALPLAARQTWDMLAPAGTLERLQVNVAHSPGMESPELTVTAEQWGNPSLSRKDLSVTPTALPYRLDISKGIVHMVGDRIVISEVDGYHGLSRLAVEGQCVRRADGRWQLDLNVLTGSRLRPDHDLISALPDEIRGSFSKLQLREPVSLRGTTQLILPDLTNTQAVFSWNMLLQLEGNRIADSGPVHDIRGEIAVRGTASGDTAVADGTVRIDSMHVNDLQLTNIQGPFTIRGSNLRLGNAQGAADQPRTPITGNLFQGDVRLEGDVLLSSGGFDVDLALERGDLVTLLTELGQTQVGLRGVFGGKIRLEGNLGATNLLRGNGKAALTEASMYQLPVLMQVFNQLRLTPAEDVAFTDGTTNFSIDGDLLTLTDLNLWGDLVALSGGGTVNGRRELDLAFNTRVSPQNAWSRLVRPLSSSRYALWTINVSGSVSQPKIEGRALEAVGETLERLFPLTDRRSADLPLATGENDTTRSADRRPGLPKTGGSPWPR